MKMCLPPVFVLVNRDKQIPVWPNPLKTTTKSLPIFCPMEHQATILQKFWVHFHQHPEIPLNDANGTHLKANEIHHGAAKDMYCTTIVKNITWHKFGHTHGIGGIHRINGHCGQDLHIQRFPK